MQHTASALFSGGKKPSLVLATLLLALIWPLAAPTSAQTASGDLAGKEAQIIDTADTDNIVNRVVVDAAGCEVEDGASIVVEDEDGTEAELVDGQNVEISVEGDQVTAEGKGADGNIHGLALSGGTFDPGTGEVVRSSGISCSGGGDDGGTDGGDDGGNGGGAGDGGGDDGDGASAAGGDVDLRVVDCSQVQSAIASQDQYGDANATARGAANAAAAEIRQELGISQEQVNACLGGDGGDGDSGTGAQETEGTSETASVQQYGNEKVLTDTIPDQKVLAETGGMPLGGAALVALALIGAGVSILRNGMFHRES